MILKSFLDFLKGAGRGEQGKRKSFFALCENLFFAENMCWQDLQNREFIENAFCHIARKFLFAEKPFFCAARKYFLI